jgi:fatty-acyl-CoA synthase
MRKPASRTAPDLLDEMAERFAGHDFVIDGDVRFTYAGFRAAVRDHAKGLHALGLRRGGRLAILMDNRHEWLITYFAAMVLGGEVVALNTWSTGPELAYQIGHADVRFLVAESTVRDRGLDDVLRELRAAGLGRLPKLIVVGAASVGRTAFADLPALGAEVPDAAVRPGVVRPGDTACILYTSGSTATPKGVPLLHGGMIENMWPIGERMHVTPDDRLWLAVSLFWSFSCVNALFTMMTHGGAIVLQHRFDAVEALALIEAEGCTVFYGMPTMALAMTEHPDRARHDLRSLRTGATIGTPAQIQRIVDLGVRNICNVYGLTEAYGNSAVTDAHDSLARRLACSGRALDGVDIRIVDPASGAVLASGVMGEIRLRGNVTPGYLNDPERTAEAFDADGYFRTGDLGVLDDEGFLTFQGRLKELVKTGGINVAPAEVEAVLRAHGGIAEAYVVGVPDARLDEALAAVIICAGADGEAPSPDDLRTHCRRTLSAYKIPRHFKFVTAGDLPLTSTGKLQKNRLADMFIGGH